MQRKRQVLSPRHPAALLLGLLLLALTSPVGPAPAAGGPRLPSPAPHPDRDARLLDVRSRADLSRLAWERMRYDDAIGHARAAATLAARIDDGPGEFLARTRELRALIERSGRRAEAWALLATLEARDRSSLDARTALEFYTARGMLHRARGHVDLARKNLEEAVRRGGALPETVLPLLQLARLESHLVHADVAERHLDEAGRRLLAAPGSAFLQACLAVGEAVVLQNHGRFQQSLRLLLGAVELQRRVPNPLAEAEARLELAGLLLGHRDLAPANRQLQEALALCERTPEPTLLRHVADGLVASLAGGTDSARATRVVADLRRVLALMREPDDRVAVHLDLVQVLAQSLHDARATDAELAAALDVARRSGRRDLEAWVEARWGSACIDRFSDWDRAEPHLQRALALGATLPLPPVDDRERGGWIHPGTLHVLLGTLRLAQSRDEEADAHLLRALEAHADDDDVEARCGDLRLLVQVALARQDVEQAEQRFQRMLDEVRRLPYPISRAVWTSIAVGPLLGGQGTNRLLIFEDPASPEPEDSPATLLLQRIVRDRSRAEALLGACREWIELSERRSEHQQRCIALMVRCLVLDGLGRPADALDSAAQGLELARKSSLQGLLSLGYYVGVRVLLRQGRYGDAEAMVRRAAEELATAGLAGEQGLYLTQVAALRLRAHDPKGALPWADRAVAVARTVHGRSPMRLALALAIQGRSRVADGRLADGRASYEEAVRVAHASGTGRDEAALEVLIARMEAAQGQTDRALAGYTRALQRLRAGGWNLEIRDFGLEAGEFLEKAGRPEAALACYQETIRAVVAWREQLPDRSGQQLVSDQRATRWLFERAIDLLMARHDHAEALRLLGLSHSLEVLGSVDVTHLRADSPDDRARLEKLARLRRELAGLRARVQEADPARRAGLEQTLAGTREQFFATLNDIRRSQPDFDQLLTVRATDLAALQRRLPENALLVEFFPATDALFVLEVTRDGLRIRRVDVGRERLAALVRRFREGLADPRHPLDAATGATLHDLLIGGLPIDSPARDPAHPRRLLVVPSGILWNLPLEALRDARGRYLVERAEVGYLSSADVLNLVTAGDAPRPAPRLLALGDPTGADLPGTRREVAALRTLFPGARALLGAAATREALWREAPRASVLHLASHGTLDEADPNRSAIELAGGPLRLAEVYGLRLLPGTLVVLGACRSAVGGESPGRDLVSLATAFTSAGATTVVASLWRVDDEATADLMGSFYLALKQGAGRAAALRRAKLDLLLRPATRHPFYWAGFTLLGDPR